MQVAIQRPPHRSDDSGVFLLGRKLHLFALRVRGANHRGGFPAFLHRGLHACRFYPEPENSEISNRSVEEPPAGLPRNPVGTPEIRLPAAFVRKGEPCPKNVHRPIPRKKDENCHPPCPLPNPPQCVFAFQALPNYHRPERNKTAPKIASQISGPFRLQVEGRGLFPSGKRRIAPVTGFGRAFLQGARPSRS